MGLEGQSVCTCIPRMSSHNSWTWAGERFSKTAYGGSCPGSMSALRCSCATRMSTGLGRPSRMRCCARMRACSKWNCRRSQCPNHIKLAYTWVWTCITSRLHELQTSRQNSRRRALWFDRFVIVVFSWHMQTCQLSHNLTVCARARCRVRKLLLQIFSSK